MADYSRYGADCNPEAGAVPCELIDFSAIKSEVDFNNRIKALFDHVFHNCSPMYKAKWESWLARFHDAVICPVNECALMR
jgi:hypothetical protein